jgi:5-methylcytosine-specific restriction endonuclease McrA
MERKSHSEETKVKISLAKKGKPLSEKHKLALRKGHKEMSEESRKRMSRGKGEINHHWKGGNWRYWKRQALTRDDYTCQICGFREVEIMEVDHVKQKSKYPELMFVLENLLTLCPNCHRRKTIRELKSQIPWNKRN